MSDTPDGTTTGWAAIPRWVLWETDLSASARLALAALVVRENRVGECWPSHARLASDTALSVTTVKGALRELRELRAAGRERMQMSKE